eukprot:jgi/Hompol1/981/HPOL_005475-RA
MDKVYLRRYNSTAGFSDVGTISLTPVEVPGQGVTLYDNFTWQRFDVPNDYIDAVVLDVLYSDPRTIGMLLAIGLNLLLSSLVCRSVRMYVIFKYAHEPVWLYSRTIGLPTLLCIVVASMTPTVTALIVQTVGFPIQVSVGYDDATSTTYTICGVPDLASQNLPNFTVTKFILAYLIILICIASIMAFVNRILPDGFNDVREIMFSMYVLVGASAFAIFQGFSTKYDAITQFIVESTTVIFVVLVINATVLLVPIAQCLRMDVTFLDPKNTTHVNTDGEHYVDGGEIEHLRMISSGEMKTWEHADPTSKAVFKISVKFFRERKRNNGKPGETPSMFQISQTASEPVVLRRSFDSKNVDIIVFPAPLFMIGLTDQATYRYQIRFEILPTLEVITLEFTDEEQVGRSVTSCEDIVPDTYHVLNTDEKLR